MKFLVILICKTLQFGLRITARNGTALPGLIAERLRPTLMQEMLSTLPHGSVVVTGTNGKTTTTKIVTELFESQGLRVVSNPSGSNFTRGIYSALIRQGSLTGKLDYDIGVFELDEAYSKYFAALVKPKQILVLNIMRDQLDRYGEIDTTAQHIGAALEFAEGAVFNADDPPVAALASRLKDQSTARYFGVAPGLKQFLPSDDELFGESLASAESSNEMTTELLKARMGGGEERMTFRLGAKEYSAHFPLEGVHNAQNAVAALALVHTVLPEADPQKLAAALSRIHPAFGRGEQLIVNDRKVHIALVKNPGGFNQNLRAFIKKEMGVILILINDNYADGRDTSWLWDVDFSEITKHDPKIIVGGIRAHDIALRLQYEGISVTSIETNVAKALQTAIATEATEDAQDVLVFPTYTAMLETRKVLEKDVSVEGIW